jgi:hypothetical protein
MNEASKLDRETAVFETFIPTFGDKEDGKI